jgi:hypothetical protein
VGSANVWRRLAPQVRRGLPVHVGHRAGPRQAVLCAEQGMYCTVQNGRGISRDRVCSALQPSRKRALRCGPPPPSFIRIYIHVRSARRRRSMIPAFSTARPSRKRMGCRARRRKAGPSTGEWRPRPQSPSGRKGPATPSRCCTLTPSAIPTTTRARTSAIGVCGGRTGKGQWLQYTYAHCDTATLIVPYTLGLTRARGSLVGLFANQSHTLH